MGTRKPRARAWTCHRVSGIRRGCPIGRNRYRARGVRVRRARTTWHGWLWEWEAPLAARAQAEQSKRMR